MLRILFCVGMYVCMSVTFRNVNFCTLRMLQVRGVCKGCGRTALRRSNAKNGKKTMHADAMDGSISTKHEDSDQRRRRLATLSLHHAYLTSHIRPLTDISTITSNTRRSLPLHQPSHVRMREALN